MRKWQVSFQPRTIISNLSNVQTPAPF